MVNRVEPTWKLLVGAAMDAANGQMRRADRTAWNEDDYNLASDTLARLTEATEVVPC